MVKEYMHSKEREKKKKLKNKLQNLVFVVRVGENFIVK